MLKAIRGDAGDSLVIAQRDKLVRSLPPRDKRAEAQAIYNLANHVIRYTEDPPNIDTMKTAPFVIERFHRHGEKTAGDCVTQSVLVGTLARSLNIPVRLRLIGEDSRNFYHVHPELFINRHWVAADVTATTAENAAIRRRAGLGFRASARAERIYNV